MRTSNRQQCCSKHWEYTVSASAAHKYTTSVSYLAAGAASKSTQACTVNVGLSTMQTRPQHGCTRRAKKRQSSPGARRATDEPC